MINSVNLATTKVKQVHGNIVSDMDGEKVMFSITNGKYYNLGDVGGEIWDQMKEPVTIQAIIDTMLSLYEVEEELCTEHVLSFLTMLTEEELIVRI